MEDEEDDEDKRGRRRSISRTCRLRAFRFLIQLSFIALLPSLSVTGPVTVTVTSASLPSSTLASEARCSHSSEGQDGTSEDIDLSVDHHLFTTDLLLPSITYQVSIEPGPRVEDYSLWSDGRCLVGNLDPVEMTINFTAPVNATQVVFTLRYHLIDDAGTYHLKTTRQVSEVCETWVQSMPRSNLSSNDLPFHESRSCLLHLTPPPTTHALVVSILRLNVPCSKGGLILGESTRLCGKLLEIPESDRTIYFPDGLSRLLVEGSPVFHMSWRYVDPCYNVTLLTRNASLDIAPTTEMSCTYRLLLPYGYKASITLRLPSSSQESRQLLVPVSPSAYEKLAECPGVALELKDEADAWLYCSTSVSNSAFRELQLLSTGNAVRIRVEAKAGLLAYPTLSMKYEAVGEESLIKDCPWPWIRHSNVCLRVVESEPLPWDKAENDCVSQGGHLISIRSQELQDLVNIMLFNSPGYRDDNSYWIGANDMRVEGDFQWSDSLPFTYTNWFPGWQGETNKQPNDDGLSAQDCVELRRLYKLPSSNFALSDSYMWNDRDCGQANSYICQRVLNGGKIHLDNALKKWECNRTVTLTPEDPRTTIASPDFPRPYPDETVCITKVEAPPGFMILIEFEELVLEQEPDCSYDYVELTSGNTSEKFCGDWSDRLKLLRRTLADPSLVVKFLSDYSHHFGGFKVKISIEQTWPECGDERLQLYNHSCYLIVSYPEVTWHTATEICKGVKGQLASVHTIPEERFIVRKIRESREYSTSAVYWIGARTNNLSEWFWTDGSKMDYYGWVSNESKRLTDTDDHCLSLQWTLSPTPLLPSSFYWATQDCDTVGGYVCKKPNIGSGRHLNLNRTINGSEGSLTSPQHPSPYLNNLDYWITVVVPERNRIVFIVHSLDLEFQPDCLYDFIEINDPPEVSAEPNRLCGRYEYYELEKLRIVSSTNVARIHFHSDYSITGNGFSLSWYAVDVSGCPLHTTTAKQGVLTSPNYPFFLLSKMDCSTTVLAPVGKRVYLEVVDYDSNESILEVDLGGGQGRLVPYSSFSLITDGAYISSGERMQITLRTGDSPSGRGYKAIYKAVSEAKEERVIEMNSRTEGKFLQMNYPFGPPTQADITQRLFAPLGSTIHLQFNKLPEKNGVEELASYCTEDNFIEVVDSYSDSNGTLWRLCSEDIGPQLSIESWLNTLKVRTVYGKEPSPSINVTVTLKPDPNYKDKLRSKVDSHEPFVETCKPDPCQNGGQCVTSLSGKNSCQCIGHFVGIFCGLTMCDVNPCLFGTCELTPKGFRCLCKPGYHGETCEQRHRPCSSNPCDSRGACIEKSGTNFECRCHAWWEGRRCERRMLNIPYKPLSERMLHEPFWLGLITVTIVLAVLGLFWCAKRHFPEKLEKLLAEENERNRPYMSTRHCPSVRERTLAMSATREGLATLAAGSGGIGGSTGSCSSGSGPMLGGGCGQRPAEPKSLLGRLGIRKPSLLSTPSFQPPGAAHFHSRTFSLDDLITGSTSPSPRKKRNNSTPTKCSLADKKQILQQLVSPASVKASATHSDNIPLSGNSLTVDVPSTSNAGGTAETSFNKLTPDQSLKLEKKVTFARLLDKVSSEMSSGSEVEIAGNSSMSPTAMAIAGTNRKSPNSTSSNQGSDSRSSSETHLSLALGEMRVSGRKTVSADSILAMFRNFAAVTSASNAAISSTLTTTTPTGSFPRDEVAGSDDSSINNTPTSSSSGLNDSPMFSRKNTIQVSVLDPLTAQKSSNNLLQPPSILLEATNKCLSPIRELPTPAPSPAITPIMPRHNTVMNQTINNKSMTLELPKPSYNFGPRLQVPSSLVIPTLTVEKPSPTKRVPHPSLLHPGSPPPARSPSNVFQFSAPSQPRPLLKDLDKPNSLDLPCPPPVITITCSMTEGESDADSPAIGKSSGPPGMCYLSPFSMCSRNDRTTSDSNLSSSGYSSMASPGPSRCGSSNPLCPTDVEDHHLTMIPRRPSPLLRAPSEDSDSPRAPPHQFTLLGGVRPRSDSETLSDDPQMESNDEGFGTDQLDEKIEDGDVKSAKELEVFLDEYLDRSKTSSSNSVKHCSSFEEGLEICRTKVRGVKHCTSVEAGLDAYRITPPPVRHSGSAEDALLDPKRQQISHLPHQHLLLPSIIIDGEPHREQLIVSPVSSRSESPLSDKTGINRFSPMYYGRITDSDGLYDCSSDTHKGAKKHSGRRRERRRSKSPTRINQILLEVPSAKTSTSPPDSRSLLMACSTKRTGKPSPKRRQRPLSFSSSSSSSAESLNSMREVTLCLSSEKLHISSKTHPLNDSGEESDDDVTSRMLPDTEITVAGPRPRKISRMRAIGHQIRFLRRLEQSLKRSQMDRESSPERPLLSRHHQSTRECDGGDDDCESPIVQSSRRTPP